MVAGNNAQLELSYRAHDVYLVLGGTGTVTVVNQAAPSPSDLSGAPKLYSSCPLAHGTPATLTLHVNPGVQAYDFTFG